MPAVAYDDRFGAVLIGLVVTLAATALPSSGPRRIGLALAIYSACVTMAWMADPFSEWVWRWGGDW